MSPVERQAPDIAVDLDEPPATDRLSAPLECPPRPGVTTLDDFLRLVAQTRTLADASRSSPDDPACYGGGVSGTGDVDGPASATDNALARYDGASGKVIQNSGVTLDDNEEMIGLASLTMGERAASAPVAPGQGQFWVSDNGGDPTAPRFTSDDGVDHSLMQGSNNLSEITIAADARANLGLVIGTNVQAWDADLDAIAALGSTGFAVRTAANTWAQRSITVTAELTISNGDGVLGNPRISIAANGITNALLRDSAALSVIGRSVNSVGDPADIAAGSDHQVLRRSGTSIGFGQLNLAQSAAVTGALPIANGGTAGTTASAARTNLGVGTGDSPEFAGVNVGHASDTTITRVSAGNIAVEGNAVYRAGGTDVPIADGGTGASTAAAALINLGTLKSTVVEYTGNGSSGQTVTLTGINRAHWILVTRQDGTSSVPIECMAMGGTGSVRIHNVGNGGTNTTWFSLSTDAEQVLTLNTTDGTVNANGVTYRVLVIGTST